MKRRGETKDIAKSQKDDVMLSDPDFEEYMPSFEDSSSFPGKIGEGSSSGLNLKRTVARKGIDSFVPHTTPGSQPTLDVKWKKIEKGVAYECIARWWYDADIPFNATNSAYYQPMIDVIASCGAGYKGPRFHDIRGELLQNEVQIIQEYLTEFKQ